MRPLLPPRRLRLLAKGLLVGLVGEKNVEDWGGKAPPPPPVVAPMGEERGEEVEGAFKGGLDNGED